MNERFDASPLVEIIAELRWDVAGPRLPDGSQIPMPILPPMAQSYDLAFSKLGAALSHLGFVNSERIVPQGFPWMLHEPVIRYRHGGDAGDAPLKASSLFQIGAGIFTANAVPPYSSWDEFGPIVKDGISALLSHGLPEGQGQELHPALRYIDAFTPRLTGGAPLHEFLASVMGIELKLPDALKGISGTQMPALQIVKELEFGRLHLNIGEGAYAGEKAFIMEMVVQFNQTVPRNVDKILEALSKARNEIHTVFVSITKQIHALMDLQGIE